eukprot:tig00021254_g19719.t1
MPHDTPVISATAGQPSRGAFILFEGVDRCGKSTQSRMLAEKLNATLLRFPDRTTEIGKMIDAYLQNTKELDDRCLHLLFSANRWEAASKIEELLSAGKTLVVDRYAFSGVAFSAAKGLDFEWCKQPDTGLPAPDLVIYLDVPVDDAAKRGDYGQERYERVDFQRKVQENFQRLMSGAKNWQVLDGRGTIEEVHAKVLALAKEAVEESAHRPLARLW